MPDELVVVLIEDQMPGPPRTGRTPQDMYAAADVTVISSRPVTPPEVVEHLVVAQLAPGASFGRAFRAIQTFDFGSDSYWRLKYVQPNFVASLDPSERQPRRTFNFSARADVRTGHGVTIGGLVVPGEFPRPVVIKVRGPSLGQFGVEGVLADPTVSLYQGAQLLLENDDWSGLRDWEKEMARAICPSPDDAREPMIFTYLDPGAYTAIVRGAEGGTGVALLEIYLLDEFRISAR